MGTQAEKLTYLNDTKVAINAAIVAKGVSVPAGTPFRDYATKIASIEGGGGTPVVEPVYERPTEWLDMPVMTASDDKIVMLTAVFDTISPQHIAFLCRTSYFTYTVDWGDGTIEEFNSNTTAEHAYDYSNVNLDSTTVANYGYKQCIITVTATRAPSHNLTYVDFQKTPSIYGTIGYNKPIIYNILDMCIASSSISAIEISGSGGRYTYLGMLQNIEILSTRAFLSKTLSGLTSLKNVKVSGYTGASLAYFLQGCKLVKWVDIDVPLTCTSFSGLFKGCECLEYVNITGDTSNVTACDSMFESCVSLKSVPLFDTSNVLNMGDMFSQCNSLKSVPDFNTSKCTKMGNLFKSCHSLEVAPNIDTSKATIVDNMFDSCSMLKEIPDYDYSSALSAPFMFVRCNNVEKFPAVLNFPVATNIGFMFYYCDNVIESPTIIAPNATNINALFRNANSIQIINPITYGDITTLSQLFYGVYSITDVKMSIPATTTELINNKMSGPALDAMYTALPTVTGQTLSVTGNYGVGSDDQTIATAKGWTIIS